MTKIASLHGAGYRLVLRQPSASEGRSRQADLFGPDGIVHRPDEPVVLDLVKSERGLALNIGDAAGAQIASLIIQAETLIAGERSDHDAVGSTPFRIYQRMTSPAPAADEAMIERLGKLGDALLTNYFIYPTKRPKLMVETPAAYTYLGQFLAHEMTVWNPTGSKEPPNGQVPFDSAIDLKTIFLRPLGFPVKLPNHVKEDEGLALGETIPDLGKKFPGAGLDDLPRLDSGCAILFDPRNDQNLALSQTHVAISRFAQAALRILGPDEPDEALRRRTVIRHFQSVVLQDYLPRLVDMETWNDVMQHGRVWVAPSHEKHSLHPFHVSPEFSAAVFRFGHTMIREAYQPWNSVDPNDPVSTALSSQLLEFSYNGGGLTSGQLKQKWTTDWRHMLGLDGMDPIKPTAIGTGLSEELFCLPEYLFKKSANDRPCLDKETGHLNLARRTLMSGALQFLKSGQALAQEVQQKLEEAGSPCRIPILQPDCLNIPENDKATAIMREGQVGKRFVDQTPLWVYILREAAIFGDGNRLGPLGGRILAETLSAAVEASGTGMIVKGKRKRFTANPAFGGRSKGKFDYEDLARLAFQV